MVGVILLRQSQYHTCDQQMINITTHETTSIKVLHAQLIFQLQSFPYDPKYIDPYRVNINLPQ